MSETVLGLKEKLTNVNMNEFELHVKNVIETEILNYKDDIITIVNGDTDKCTPNLLEAVHKNVEKLYDTPKYFSRSNVKMGTSHVLRSVREHYKNVKKLESLEIVDEFVGMYVGGLDWSPFGDNLLPTKNDLIFIADDGVIRSVGVLRGTVPGGVKLAVGSWYDVGLVNNNTYINLGRIEKVESIGAFPDMMELFEGSYTSLCEVDKSYAKGFRYALLKLRFKDVSPFPIVEDDLSKPPRVFTRKNGAEFEVFEKLVVGYEPIYNNSRYSFVAKLGKSIYVEDNSNEYMVQCSFPPQIYGEQMINIFDDVIDDDADFTEIDEDESNILAELCTDMNMNDDMYVLMKITSFNFDKKKSDRIWMKGTGMLFVKASS